MCAMVKDRGKSEQSEKRRRRRSQSEQRGESGDQGRVIEMKTSQKDLESVCHLLTGGRACITTRSWEDKRKEVQRGT